MTLRKIGPWPQPVIENAAPELLCTSCQNIFYRTGPPAFESPLQRKLFFINHQLAGGDKKPIELCQNLIGQISPNFS
jgi:hypothetical protein